MSVHGCATPPPPRVPTHAHIHLVQTLRVVQFVVLVVGVQVNQLLVPAAERVSGQRREVRANTDGSNNSMSLLTLSGGRPLSTTARSRSAHRVVQYSPLHQRSHLPWSPSTAARAAAASSGSDHRGAHPPPPLQQCSAPNIYPQATLPAPTCAPNINPQATLQPAHDMPTPIPPSLSVLPHVLTSGRRAQTARCSSCSSP